MRVFNNTIGKIAVLAVVFVASMLYLAYLLNRSGMHNPLAGGSDYTLSFKTDNVNNLIPVGDVDMAGVNVGKVTSVTNDNGTATVVIGIDPNAAPVHSGVTVRIGAKSLAGESYVDVEDGSGSPLPSGTQLPASALKPAVQLRDVVASLDPTTRTALGSLVRTLGAGTADTKDNLSNAMTGLGDLGRNGYTALDAISAQSADLTTLANETTTVLGALNTGEGQIATLVNEAQQLTAATSGQQQNLADTMRALPGVLASTRTATAKLTELSTSLAPIAADLRSAAPDLNTALAQLPAVTTDLRGLLPSLNGTLQEAPATLDRVPTLAQDAVALIPQLRTTMAQLNPMLGYISPYGPELGAFFANFSAILKYTDEAGIHFFRLEPDLGTDRIVKGLPIQLPQILANSNPYPAPGGSNAATGRPFTKIYPAGS
jgi:phospholipid/cholesterol/gamma-HCH transport system substrate-binding protein